MSEKQSMVIFQPSGRRGHVPDGTSLIEAARQLGVDIESLCGEKMVCGKCIVRIEQGLFEKYGIASDPGHVSAWQEDVEAKFITAEQKEQGYRLGCVAKVQGDVLVYVPEESRAGKQVVSKAAREIPITLNPAVKCYFLTVDPPTMATPTGDFERICQGLEKEYGLKDLTIDIFCLRDLPGALRDGNWQVTVSVWNDREIIRVRPGHTQRAFGIAIDVGTTTVAGYLCDLTTMAVLDTASLMNPQCKYGEDVMSRITYHMTTEGGLERMRDDIIAGINTLIEKVIQGTFPDGETGTGTSSGLQPTDTAGDGTDAPPPLCLTREDIEDMTVCFNTVMHHIFLGLDPQFVGLSPFPPVIHHSMDIRARDLGIRINPSANIFVLPNEAGFVGADNVGVLIAEAPHKSEQMQLLIDIGTNGELVLGNKDKLISSSCATGPALEGAQIAFGMRAAPGAIERIVIDPATREVDYKVIGKDAWKSFSDPETMQAKGICGSGILDVLAELYRTGVITKSGVFNRKGLQGHHRFRKNAHNGQPEFVLAWAGETSIGRDIVITQKDIRQIQLAKGALYAGCKLMLKRMGVDRVDTVKIAGAFGTHVDREKALIMGLFPDCDINRIQGVGNAAGDGCRAALLDVDKRAEADRIARSVEYIELSVEPLFQKEFMAAMQLPHMNDQFPHLEGVVAEEILNQGQKGPKKHRSDDMESLKN